MNENESRESIKSKVLFYGFSSSPVHIELGTTLEISALLQINLRHSNY